MHRRLKPLKDRLTPAELQRRQVKNEYRTHISREHAITRGIAMSAMQVLRRGFWGRFKWLFRGK